MSLNGIEILGFVLDFLVTSSQRNLAFFVTRKQENVQMMWSTANRSLYLEQ